MATQAWKDMVAKVSALQERKRRISDKAARLAMMQAARHDPDTGGMPSLVHNWGNAASKAVWARHDARMNRVFAWSQAEYRKLYDAALAAERGANRA